MSIRAHCFPLLLECTGEKNKTVKINTNMWQAILVSKPPLNPLSVRRLAGRNQTFTTRAPPAVVLLPQLINNRRTIVDGRERTGSRIARNSLNPATSSSLPRNCEFRFLVSSSNLSGKIVGLAPGKPVKACLCPSLPDIHGHHVERQTWLL